MIDSVIYWLTSADSDIETAAGHPRPGLTRCRDIELDKRTIMKAKQGIKLEQLAAGFERGIGALDELRVMQLGDGLRLQGAQNRVQAREYERLKRKYGEEHPRTLNAAARIELGKDHMQVISTVHAGASSPRPDAGEGWAVDGFVRRASGDPVGGLTVAAYDRQDRWYQELGYACTNEKGYFSIIVAKLPARELRVYMRASKGKRLLESNEVRLAPAPKSHDRVELIIGAADGQGECMPPSGGKVEPRPPDETPHGRDQPAPSAQEAKETGAATGKPAPDSGPRGEQKGKASREVAEKPKESGKRGGFTQKEPPPKRRK